MLWLPLLVGCAQPNDGPVVIFADGAGWFGGEAGIRAGLEAAGRPEKVEVFGWSSLLGPGPDHFLVDRKRAKGKQLAKRVQAFRAEQPDTPLHLMGLSAGTAIIVFALEQLPAGVHVDNVVLFSPSISDQHDLSDAMAHVRGYLYATTSLRDGILSGMVALADGEPGKPAGLRGLRVPPRARRRSAYARVVNLHWRPAYGGFGWMGSHTAVTGSRFVQHVIAPRIASRDPHPLDRPVLEERRHDRDTLAGTP